MSTVRKLKEKSFWELTDAEKRQATKEFDEEFIIDSFRELSPQERLAWDKIQRRLKCTDPHPTYQSVSARLPQSMVKKLDELAARRHISRSKLILLGLGVYLAQDHE